MIMTFIRKSHFEISALGININRFLDMQLSNSNRINFYLFKYLIGDCESS